MPSCMTEYSLEQLTEALRETEYGDRLDSNPIISTDKGIIVGDVEVRPGADKPVLLDALTKRKLPGSGQYPRKHPINSSAVALTGEVLPANPVAYRTKIEYREKFEELFPAGGDVQEKGSLAYAFDQFWAACEGSPQEVMCPHPDVHKDEHTPPRHIIAFKKDAAALFKMIELGVGKAAQTQNINLREEKLVKVLEQRTIDIKVHGISSEEVNSRMQMIESYGYDVGGKIDVGTSDAGTDEVGTEPWAATDAGSGDGAADYATDAE